MDDALIVDLKVEEVGVLVQNVGVTGRGVERSMWRYRACSL
jgi:hypothetical protein